MPNWPSLCRFTLVCLTLAVSSLAASVPASHQPIHARGERDWLLPSEIPVPEAPVVSGEQRAAAPAAGSACPSCTTGKVVYGSFQSGEITLNSFAGKYVQVLLPDFWVERFSEEELTGLVESSDRAYEILRDLVGGEPFLPADGRLTQAVVPVTCGLGCGTIGHGRSEFWNGRDAETGEIDEIWIDSVRALAVQGIPHNAFIHEMTHNFDIYASHLWYHGDSAHFWTDVVGIYGYIYGLLETETTVWMGPIDGRLWYEREASWLDALRKGYGSAPSHDWATCVREGSCEGIAAREPRAMVALEIVRQTGPRALAEALRFLHARRSTTPPATEAGKEELWLEALAAGAGGDLTACLQAENWLSSLGLQSRMAAHGPPAPFCQDADGDSRTPWGGDCDDSNAFVHPGAAEVPGNGVDDDCNGAVDEVIVSPAGVPETLPSPPFSLRLALDSVGHYPLFDPAGPGRLGGRYCSPAGGYDGWIALLNPGWSQQFWSYLPAGGCARTVARTDPSANWTLHFSGSAEPGQVRVDLAPLADWPQPWGTLTVRQLDDRRLALTARVDDPSAWRFPGNQVRFEVSGYGRVGTAALAGSVASREWTAPQPFAAGRLVTVAAQPLAGELPAGPVVRRELRPIDISPCVAADDAACLLGGRFEVTGVMRDFASPPKAYPLRVMDFPGGRAESAQAAFFDSFKQGNFEIGVKMVDGCGLPAGDPSRAYWLFVGGLTSAESLVRVEDTATQEVYEWTNPRNNLPLTHADTAAFPCEGGPPAQGACTAAGHRACLLGRFEVSGEMQDFASPPKSYPLRVMDFPGGRAESAQAAFFDSFKRGNFEIGVKMVDGCGLPAGDPSRAYWLFVGGLTSADTRLEVRQVSTGEIVEWENPPGKLPRSTADTAAFACE